MNNKEDSTDHNAINLESVEQSSFAQLTESLLVFWFGELDEQGFASEEKKKLWFMGGERFDLTCRETFGGLLDSLAIDDPELFIETLKITSAQQRLAWIVLFDQIPRNIYRGTAKAFAFDEVARLLVKQGLCNSDDKGLSVDQRAFYYMPLEHSEDLNDQNLCVESFDALIQDVNSDRETQIAQGYREYAVEHQAIIERFGRFPHRNPSLGRKSTDEEAEYLASGGKTYGQNK